MGKIAKGERASQADRIDPDPISIVLFVLTGISAAADVIALVRAEQERRGQYREAETRRKVGIALVDVEARLLDVKSSFEAISLRISHLVATNEFRFGANLMLFDSGTFRAVNAQIQRMLNAIRQLHKAVEQCILQIYRSDLDWEGSPANQLVDLREECNRILWGSRSLHEALERVDQLIDRSVESIRKLRVWLDMER